MELPDYEMPALGVDDLVADGEKQAPPWVGEGVHAGVPASRPRGCGRVALRTGGDAIAESTALITPLMWPTAFVVLPVYIAGSSPPRDLAGRKMRTQRPERVGKQFAGLLHQRHTNRRVRDRDPALGRLGHLAEPGPVLVAIIVPGRPTRRRNGPSPSRRGTAPPGPGDLGD